MLIYGQGNMTCKNKKVALLVGHYGGGSIVH